MVVADRGCEPLGGAVLDVWHADAEGVYGGGEEGPCPWALRGRLQTGPGGAYALDTVLPGPYWDEGRMRPAHVHFKVTCEGHASLTTQLFFTGDPFLYDDPHVLPGLIRPLERRCEGCEGALECRFDIVLRRLAGEAEG